MKTWIYLGTLLLAVLLCVLLRCNTETNKTYMPIQSDTYTEIRQEP